MKKIFIISALLLLSSTAFAWETIGDGIEYQQWSISGPNNVYVARMIRSNPGAGIAMISANDSYSLKENIEYLGTCTIHLTPPEEVVAVAKVLPFSL